MSIRGTTQTATTTRPETLDGHVWALDPRYMAAVRRSVQSGHVDPSLAADSLLHAPAPPAASIVVLPLVGCLMYRGGYYADMFGSSTDGFVRRLRAAAANPDISTILIDCDSPGGVVDGVPEAWQAIMDVRKKQKKYVIAIANTLMASAAYWICSAADEIVATPSAEVGSIGVFILHMELSRMFEEEGVGINMIRQPPSKADANMFEPLSDAARADLQAKVDETYRAFTKQVAMGRKKKQTEVQETFGQGRTMLAPAAVEVGMVDRVMTFDALVTELLEASLTARAGKNAAVEGPNRMALAAEPPVAESPVAVAGSASRNGGSHTDGEPTEATAEHVGAESDAAADESFGCGCGINCQCQDGQRRWCDETCPVCSADCACRQRTEAAAAEPVQPVASAYAVQAAADADALELASIEGR